jgi:hypothetical protein
MFVSQSTTKLCNYFLISSIFSALCIYRHFNLTENLLFYSGIWRRIGRTNGEEWSAAAAGACYYQYESASSSNGNGWRERWETERRTGERDSMSMDDGDGQRIGGPACCQLERPFCPLLTRSVRPSTATLFTSTGSYYLYPSGLLLVFFRLFRPYLLACF